MPSLYVAELQEEIPAEIRYPACIPPRIADQLRSMCLLVRLFQLLLQLLLCLNPSIRHSACSGSALKAGSLRVSSDSVLSHNLL